MSEDNKRNILENALVSLPTVGGLFMMFIGAGFTVISFIYTSGQSETKDKLDKYMQKLEKYEESAAQIQSAQIQQTSRIDRHGEQISENTTDIKALTNRMQELEKAEILSNANRR